MRTIELKKATKRNTNDQLTISYNYKILFKNWVYRIKVFFEGNKGEVNLFAVVSVAMLVFMLMVLLIMF